MISNHLHQAISTYTATRGEKSLLYVMSIASLTCGAATELAERHAAEIVKEELPLTLVVALDPRNKNPERHRDLKIYPGLTDFAPRSVGGRQ